jgi:hypothetical protein
MISTSFIYFGYKHFHINMLSNTFNLCSYSRSSRFVTTRTSKITFVYIEGVSESFKAGRLEGELQVVQLSATRCSCIAILWVNVVSFAAITLCVASQRVFIVVYFVINSVRKLLDIPSYRYNPLCLECIPSNNFLRYKIHFLRIKKWWSIKTWNTPIQQSALEMKSSPYIIPLSTFRHA